MHKGAQVVLFLAAYALLSWLVRDHPGAPPPLVGPFAVSELKRPLEAAVMTRSAAAAEADLIARSEAETAQLTTFLIVPAASEQADGGGPSSSAAPAAPLPPRSSWPGLLARLRQLEQGRRDKVRIVQLGDSEIVADGVTGTIRSLLAERFGYGGPGFALAMAPLPWYQRDGWQHRESPGFDVYSFVYGAMDGDAYGPGGVAFHGTPGTRAEVLLQHPRPGGCTVRFFYREHSRGGVIELYADRNVLGLVDTAKPVAQLAELRRHLPACPTRLGLAVGRGPAWVYGWSVEYDTPGIVLSNLGMIAATLPQLAHYDEEDLAASLRAHDPDLIILTFGLNLAAATAPPPPSYRAEIRTVLARVRRAVDAACLVTGPYPVGYKQKLPGHVLEAKGQRLLTAHQRAAAAEAGCAFLNRFRLAGGESAPQRWLAAKPKLLSGDYQHLTPEGARRMGRAIANVILKSHDAATPDAGAASLGRHTGAGDFSLSSSPRVAPTAGSTSTDAL